MVVDPRAAQRRRPLRRDAIRNRARLLDAARSVFAEQGLRASLDEIARRAGVSIGTLYNRFGCRTDLVDAAFAERITTASEMLEQALADPDPWRAVVEYLCAIVELHATDQGFGELCAYTLPSGSATEQAKVRMSELFHRLLGRSQEAGVLRADITATDLGLLVWGVAQATSRLHSDAPGVARRQMLLVCDGLRAAAAHPLPGGPVDPGVVRQAMTFG